MWLMVRTLPKSVVVPRDRLLVPSEGEEGGRLVQRGEPEVGVRFERAVEEGDRLGVAVRAGAQYPLVQEGERVTGIHPEHGVETLDRPVPLAEGDPEDALVRSEERR